MKNKIGIFITTIGIKERSKVLLKCINKIINTIDMNILYDVYCIGRLDKDDITAISKAGAKYIKNNNNTTNPGNRNCALEYCIKNNYKVMIVMDDDCLVKDNAVNNIAKTLLMNKDKFPYIAASGNYQCFIKELREYGSFIPNIRSDVCFGIWVDFFKNNKIKWDVKTLNVNCVDICLNVVKHGGIPGLIKGDLNHRITSTKKRDYENHYKYCIYIQNKYSDMVKLDKCYRYHWINKPESFCFRYTMDKNYRIKKVDNI